MLRVGCKGFTRKKSRGRLCRGDGREIEKGFRVKTLVTNAKYIFIKMDKQKYQIGTGRLLLLMSLGLSSVPCY